MARTDPSRRLRELEWTLSASLVAAYLGNRWGMVAQGGRDLLEGLVTCDPATVAADILLRPIALSLEMGPLLCALSLFTLVWGAYALVADGRANVRRGDEYGSARRGTIREAQAYRDARDPDNNIVLTRNIGVAIRPSANVRERITARNVCVFGGSGSNKTTGFVMPNILQLGADRDVVVVDPKGTTLATCGHALVAAGIDVSVFNTVDRDMSDMYNPLAAIRSHQEIMDFVACLIENTNDGRKSSDPIWDNGEALFYRALLTLLLDWFDPEDMTLANMVMLADLADIADEGEGDRRSTLDLVFEQIETGWCHVPDDGGDEARTERTGSFSPTVPHARGALVRVPSLMRRRDGVRPALVRRPGGGRGLDPSQDEALKVWHEFRHGAGKTLKSFVISSHARLAYLSSPDVLRILAAGDGRDDIHLERLGQVTDERGRPLPPRTVFVVSSDFNPNLRALLSVFMWQAIYLPMREADTRCGGTLPRPVSLIIDEFANVGRIASFPNTIATVRSRNIDVAVMLQNHTQLESVYGKEDAATIRENCATTLFLGGGRNAQTAKVIAEELGKETVYKEDHTRSGAGLSATASTQRTSLARDVFDAGELATLPQGKALVIIGDKQPVLDDKSLVWHHRNYDPAYMGREPSRRFDYAAWRDAGRPRAEALAAWEDAWFGSELPARQAHADAARDLAIAAHEVDEARSLAAEPRSGRALRVALARMEVLACREATARARLDLAHAEALVTAGGRARVDSYAAELSICLAEERLAADGVRDALAHDEAAEALAGLSETVRG